MFIPKPEVVYAAAKTMADITLRLNTVEIVTPLNAHAEKDKWLNAARKGVFRNPTFTYDYAFLSNIAQLEPKLLSARHQLLDNLKPQDLIDEILLEIINDRIEDAHASIKLAQAILNRDDATSEYYTAKKFGRPNAVQIAEAERLTMFGHTLGVYEPLFDKDQRKALKDMRFDATQISEHFRRAIDYYGIEGWIIVIDEHATAIDVRNKTANGTPCIVIPSSREVNGLKLLELIGHEIECHLRDSENAAQLFRDLIGSDSPLMPLVPLLAKPDDEMMYEGHAKLSDVRFSGSSALPKPFYTIAQYRAVQRNSFAEVANHIYELQLNLDQSESAAVKGAWLATYRALRGVTDTKNPHGYTFGKDYGYLAGFSIARDLQRRNWLDYASLRLIDLQRLSACAELDHPKYPYKDAVQYVASRLM